MNFVEQFLVRLDIGPWSAVWRAALGFCIPAAFRAVTGERDAIWVTLALFLGMMIGLRVIPAVIRMALPFSAETKAIWSQRRQMAKRYDSYQWQKLLWIGAGLLAFAAIEGDLRTGEQVLALICLVGGGAGLAIWRKTDAMQPA